LENDDATLSSLEGQEDEIIVFMNNIVDEAHYSVVDYQPDLNFEGLNLSLVLHRERESGNGPIEKIDKILEKSAMIFSENLSKTDILNALGGSAKPHDADNESEDDDTLEVTTFDEMVQDSWNCIGCGAVLSDVQIDCPMCKLFRPLETFPNMMHRPYSITK